MNKQNCLRSLIVLALGALLLPAQQVASLKRVPVPNPPELARYVQDRQVLVALGKAFFWDMQTGSDGMTACATCHFHAGADHRQQGQVANDNSGVLGVNRALQASDFPIHQFSNGNDNSSAVVRTSNAVIGSAGVFRRVFSGFTGDSATENGFDWSGESPQQVDGVNVRQVTTRNSPSVINAVFNFRNFWDGRAKDAFTGRTPFGESDPSANAIAVNEEGAAATEAVRIPLSSLASQAVGPPLNGTEMSYEGRNWTALARKLLPMRTLALQKVASDDSVLGPMANPDGPGLAGDLTYEKLIMAAFQPAYWSSAQGFDAAGTALQRPANPESLNESSQIEFNFPLFWGLALQAYQSTLVADDSRVDRFLDGDTTALNNQEQRGLQIFQGQAGECSTCHAGPEFTLASIGAAERIGVVQGRRGANGLPLDTGFFRIGVQPIADDAGLGGVDSFGFPLSTATSLNGNALPRVQGLFKTPGLRNVELTGPYFHNGGKATLNQVVDFYARGGDFPADGNLGPDIRNRNLNPADRAALTAFLKALSDDRVKFEQAPFDHPELCVPAGYQQDGNGALLRDFSDPRFASSATDLWVSVPAVGSGGNAVPLQTFEELLLGIGANGERAHTMTEACSIRPR